MSLSPRAQRSLGAPGQISGQKRRTRPPPDPENRSPVAVGTARGAEIRRNVLRRTTTKYCKPYPFVQSATLAVYDGQNRIGSIAEHDGEHHACDVTLTPLEAVRRKCLWCCNGSTHEVALCPARACPSWAFRFGRKPTAEIIADQGNTLLHPLEWRKTAADFHADRHPALHAIKRKCLDCSGASKSEVRNCAFTDCALHPFRQARTRTELIARTSGQGSLNI